MHTPNKPNTRKTNPTQKTPNTAHYRQSVNQTAQRAGNVVEHPVPDKNKSGALNAMRSTQRETKDTGGRARNAQRNGNVTDGKSDEQRATQRERNRREVERAVRDGTETGRAGKWVKNAQRNETGRWERTGGK